MNGRVYDPVLGRFLSADPVIQFPESTQGLNRYTYVNNNPLSFTDPSGFFFKSLFNAFKSAFKAVASVAKAALSNQFVRIGLVIAISVVVPQLVLVGIQPAATPATTAAITASGAIGGPIAATGVAAAASAAGAAAASSVGASVLAAAAGGFAAGFVESGGDLKAAGIGALTAGAFKGVGVAGFFGGTLAPQRILAHGAIVGTRNALQGGSFVRGFVTGAVSKIATPFSTLIGGGTPIGGALASAAVGGTVAELGGGKFSNGALTGAYGYLFNDVVTRRATFRIPAWLRRITLGPDHPARGISVGAAVSFPGFYGGKWDSGLFFQFHGGGEDYGTGAYSEGITYGVGDVESLSGRGAEFSFNDGVGGLSLQLDSQNTPVGVGLHLGLGYNIGGTGTITNVYTRRNAIENLRELRNSIENFLER